MVCAIWRALRSGVMISISLACLAMPGRASDITIFAAASLKTALDEVAAAFEGPTTTISYAGTPVLARQISFGAPADIFIAASLDWMDWLADQNRIDPASRFDLLSNRLVLIRHGAGGTLVETTGTALMETLGQDRIAMALVAAVPAGIYGKSALQYFGLWDALAPQIAQSDNVRAALALVARGEAPFGIVYTSDAQAEPRISVIATFPEESHAPILYPVAVTKGRSSTPVARFINHLRSAQARVIFERHGFIMADPAP
ncbi:Molybdate-binding protein ModA [Roseobacter fucihabitans]|uniref:Molybdate-binding protein ModA n=1 Tax=Roseobacter fucihabitans TaxID=1537242 RepID=A0ABZ2BRI5_9RHOB|nr:molybdate ABC transporter substrate-binding protein [Roseobacter litoralis]MBC6964487.1 Molybdate-binding periplasmic protein precursor [Roseobacter litoralis]